MIESRRRIVDGGYVGLAEGAEINRKSKRIHKEESSSNYVSDSAQALRNSDDPLGE
jgi:hypothetical protein